MAPGRTNKQPEEEDRLFFILHIHKKDVKGRDMAKLENIYYDMYCQPKPNYDVPEKKCKGCGNRLNILQWDKMNTLYMYICRNIHCLELNRPQGGYSKPVEIPQWELSAAKVMRGLGGPA